jgi:immune inhibitor A
VYTYGTLAHEFQHMIEWHQHRNQSTWMSEGSAELAAFLNGYNPGGFDRLFALNPDLQLNDWPDPQVDPNAEAVHYGASFLFMDYFLSRFGEKATQTLVGEPANGLEGVAETLKALQAVDPLTGQAIGVDDLFLDWAVTNYVNDASVGDGRYVYQNYAGAPKARSSDTVAGCPLDPTSRTVHQYATDYIVITCRGSYTLHFTGSSAVRLLPADPHSGAYAFWSNKGDSSDMRLTHAFDFSKVSGPISFNYWTWYDLENTFDYVYLEASTDGQHWQILTTPSGTADNATGSSFGWGYTGSSNGWRQETVDLSAFAGRNVSIRFEYVTDLGVNGEGFLLDDVSVPAAGYASDFEKDGGGWQAQGFTRIENVLPQTFKLALIQKTSKGTTVQIVPVGADETADVPLSVGQNGVSQAILVVSATTPFTRQEAAYQFTIK